MGGNQGMVVLIVLIVMIASVFRARYTYLRKARGADPQGEGNSESQRLRDEVRQLKDRIEVLERITVEKENSLARQIEALKSPLP